jgi:hypothetical protein
MAGVSLDAAEREVAVTRNSTRKIQGLFDARRAGAMTIHIELDKQIDLRAGRVCRLRESIDHLAVVDHGAKQDALAGKCGKASQLIGPGHRAGQMEIVETRVRKPFGLSNGRYAQAGCTGGNLSFPDLGTFMSLGMRTKVKSRTTAQIRHEGNVCIQGGKFDDQAWRGQLRPFPQLGTGAWYSSTDAFRFGRLSIAR